MCRPFVVRQLTRFLYDLRWFSPLVNSYRNPRSSLVGKEWKEYIRFRCGTGLSTVSIPAKATAEFTINFGEIDWVELRVGLIWYDSPDENARPRRVWSKPIDKQDVLTR